MFVFYYDRNFVVAELLNFNSKPLIDVQKSSKIITRRLTWFRLGKEKRFFYLYRINVFPYEVTNVKTGQLIGKIVIVSLSDSNEQRTSEIEINTNVNYYVSFSEETKNLFRTDYDIHVCFNIKIIVDA